MKSRSMAELVATRLNKMIASPGGLGDDNARTTAQELGLPIDDEATGRLLDIIGDSDPVAFRDGSFVRCDSETGRYWSDVDVSDYIANN